MNDPLLSWNDNETKQKILGFIRAVTDPDSVNFVPPAERIATFDNDGTLWLEKPLFAAGDMRGVMILGSGFAEAYDGITVEDFEAEALKFLNNAQDGRFKKPYKLLTYQPMVELVHTLQENGFQVYIATGGGRDFVRAVCENIYNVPRSMTIGSSILFQYGEDAQGVAQVIRTKEVEQPIDDGPGKPLHIHRSIGRRPIMAVGNSDGDIHMLKYAAGNQGSTLGLLLNHDDAEREYAYNEGTEKALQLAPKAGWCVVSMKNDWKTVFS
jgi:phosphoglycolate phosphatase-like HAD superfamily hydrolase